jgi:hypothetical protein
LNAAVFGDEQYVVGLWAFLSLHDLEVDLLAVLEIPPAGATDAPVVDEDVGNRVPLLVFC